MKPFNNTRSDTWQNDLNTRRLLRMLLENSPRMVGMFEVNENGFIDDSGAFYIGQLMPLHASEELSHIRNRRIDLGAIGGDRYVFMLVEINQLERLPRSILTQQGGV